MAIAPTVVLPVDVDTRKLAAVSQLLGRYLHQIAGQVRDLGDTFDEAGLQLEAIASFERSRRGGEASLGHADAAHR